MTRDVTENRWRTALFWIVAALVLLSPLLMFPFLQDMFRLPKRMLFYAGTIGLLTTLVAATLGGHDPLRRASLRNPSVVIAFSVLAWTLIATLASSRVRLSAAALAVCGAYVLFFLTAKEILPERSLGAIWVVLLPAAANAALVIAQESGWQPFELQDFWYDRHLASTGFMGNPNDVGSLLMGPALSAIALACVTKAAARVASIAAAVLLTAGILASQTLTATIALAVGVAALLLLVSWRRAMIGLAVIAAVTLLLAGTYQPLRGRLSKIERLARQRDYNALLTNRLTPFAAAFEMVRQDPLSGRGPGTFGWNYFDAKVAVERKYPGLIGPDQRLSWNYNFSEVHNDHLEILAETGVPGYILFVAALGVLASISFRASRVVDGEPRREFARIFALPLALGFAVLALAQFPLQIPAAATMYLFLAASVSWSGVEDLQSTRHTAARLAPWWLHLSTAAAAVAGLCAIYVVSIAPLRCNRQLRQLEEATTLTLRSPAQIAAPAARETLEKTGSLLGHCRNRLPLLMVRAANLRALGRREEAAAAYREALVIEKRPEIYFQLGTTLFEDGRVQDSVEEYARACRFQPSLLSEVPQPVRDEVESRLR